MKIFEDNRHLKIIAILAAVVLWLYVGAQENPIDKHTYYVTVSVKNVDADKAATLPQQTVGVTVIGRQDRLNAISAADFSAYVDLKDVKTGENDVQVDVDAPNEVYITDVTPRKMNVLITQREGRSMDVDIIRSGVLNEGVEIVNMRVEPETVFVSGDAEALRQVARVGVAVDYSDVLSDSALEAKVVCYDYLGNAINAADLTTSPESVKLVIDVNENEVTKQVPVQANLTGSLPDGIQLESVSVSPETVAVTDLPSKLAKITELRTEPIDISTITETTSITVAIDSDYLDTKEMVTVTLAVGSDAAATNTTEKTYVKVVPIVITGAASDMVTSDTKFVEVSYHLVDGEKDLGEDLKAFVSVAEAPTGETTAQVQFASIEGLVIDSITPSTITIYSVN